MAAQLPASEPNTLSFETEVEAVDDQAIALAETYFYAESGGQPADRGTIAGVEVTDVQLIEETVWHTLAQGIDVSPGDTVAGEVDPEFRRYCMSAHTASHAVYGAARKRFDSVGYGGFEITPTKVRLDLETPEAIDDEAMLDLERLTNEVIWEDRPVTWSEWSAEEVKERDDIAFNVATDVVHTEETVRIVEIENWDIAACGGTHMASTGRIGEVTMADRSNPGEGQTRLEFVVGPERIEQRHAEKTTAWKAKSKLGVPIEEVPERIDQLEADQRELENRVAEMEQSLVAASLTGPGATRFEVDGASWALASIPDVEANTVATCLEELIGETGDVIAVAGGEHRAHLVVASNGSIAATDIIDSTLEAFDGGGGGGSDDRAQAGGIDANADELIEHLAERFGPN